MNLGKILLSVLVFSSISCENPKGPISETVPEEAQKPNILVIMVDDMGMADLGSFGGEIDTPNLDKLANRGIRFTNFHTAPVCSVTRAMMLTGVSAHKAGLGNMAEELAPNQEGQPGYEGELNDSVVTVASILKNNGYRTYLSGKWHLGSSPTSIPSARGFDRTFTMLSGGASHFKDMRPAYHPDPDGKAPYLKNGEKLESLPLNFDYSTQFYADQMIDFLEMDKNSDQPFFAFLSYTAPHWPLHARPEIIDKYKGRYDEGYDKLRAERFSNQMALGIIPEGVKENPPTPKSIAWIDLPEDEKKISARAMEIYAAMVDDIDVQTGKVLSYLEDNDLRDNTIVFFLSDNGAEGHDLDETWPADLFPDIRKNIDDRHDFSFEAMGLPNSYVLYGPDWARAGSPAFRLHKGFPTEGGTRVAAFVHYSKFTSANVDRDYHAVIDITPTFLELAGVEHPAAMQNDNKLEPMTGISFASELLGQSPPKSEQQRIHVGEVLGKYFIQQGSWKVVHMPPPHGTGSFELYDLSSDVSEQNNLALTHPEIVERLTRVWEQYARENEVILPDWVSGY